ncbi:unnamed protein product, partial [methanotrophic bacterial endosymbiont of Bathymodiolus sp.]
DFDAHRNNMLEKHPPFHIQSG